MRRTRRNLSDPRIKHILKKQQKNNQSILFPPSGGSRSSRLPGKFGLGLLLIGIVVVSAALLKDVKLPEIHFPLKSSFSQPKGAPAKTLQEKPITTPRLKSDQSAELALIDTTQKDNPTIPQPVKRKIQVEILNGAGVEGIASKVTRYLRKNDIDVVYMGNYKNYGVKKTQILDRSGKPRNARKIALLLGLDTGRISLKKNSDLQLDATLILGADYRKMKAFK